MGYNYAADLADAVNDGLANLEGAIAVHLSGNFYPPLPGGYVQPVIDALFAVEEDEPDRMIALPGDLNPLPREVEVDDSNEMFPAYTVRAGTLVDITRTYPFLNIFLNIDEETS